MASIFGKRYPIKKFPKNQKSLGGFIAGTISTIILIIGSNLLFSFNLKPNISFISFIFIISIGYLLIDIVSVKISDNFLNSALLGIISLLCVNF